MTILLRIPELLPHRRPSLNAVSDALVEVCRELGSQKQAKRLQEELLTLVNHADPEYPLLTRLRR